MKHELVEWLPLIW